ncbi:MAG: hypothetical protein Q8P41_12875, partial [Pseudomonadota bacterium]|nr:hypothetical protein [Pseudomonadota bacterium]
MAEIGDRIGPFEIIELLEKGRLTSVYRGLRADGSTRPPREVTLRVAHGGAEGPDPAGVDAVRVEYETLRALEDDRIPQAFALYGGHGASATMWVNGASLRDTLRLVEAGRLDLDAATAIDILVELAYALRHAHAIAREEGRIVHGSLAPEVVFLTAEGKVLLLALGDPEPGHPRPLAPEQQQGVQEPRTDQWLLGALGIELLRHSPEVLEDARGASVEVAYALLQSRWPAATRVLARMLAESPAHRYESEERLIKDLLALSRHLGGVSKRAEVGARTIQLASSVRGVDAPPMPVGTLLRRRTEDLGPVAGVRLGGAVSPAPFVPVGPSGPSVAQGFSPASAPVPSVSPAPTAAASAWRGPSIRPSVPPSAGPVGASGVQVPPRLHPSGAPLVPVEAAARDHFEPPGMEEVVAYTEETPLPFKPLAPAEGRSFRGPAIAMGGADGLESVAPSAGPRVAPSVVPAVASFAMPPSVAPAVASFAMPPSVAPAVASFAMPPSVAPAVATAMPPGVAPAVATAMPPGV